MRKSFFLSFILVASCFLVFTSSPAAAQPEESATPSGEVEGGRLTAVLGEPNPFIGLKQLTAMMKTLEPVEVSTTTGQLLRDLKAKLDEHAIDFREWSMSDPAVSSLLREVAESNPAIRNLIASIYDMKIRAQLRADQADGILDLYTQMLEFRVDPSKENDELRVAIVLGAGSGDMRQFAIGRLEELRYSGVLDIPTKTRIMLHGYYGRGAPIFFISSTMIVLVCLILMIFRPAFIAGVSDAIIRAEQRAKARSQKQSQKQSQRSSLTKSQVMPRTAVQQTRESSTTTKMTRPPPGHEQQRDPKQSMFRREKTIPGYAKGPVEQDEYARLLTFLELDDDASESDIKRAYRERVKTMHPDVKGGDPNVPDEEFVELKEVYDRILQIRSSWFGGRK